MNRLQSEMHRLYHPQASDADGRVRAMMLELARPADWQALGALWRGVQADLELPAPAIAVSGVDGYQLWFSLAEPLPVAQARAFLEALQARYLGDIAAERVLIKPSVAAAAVLPPRLVQAEQWSAFVAPDLAPVFAEEPWLDTEPGIDGQADLLARLQSIKPADFQRALERLGPISAPTPAAAPAGVHPDPKSFLLSVMNDDSVALALRIEAAKALLPCFDEPQRRG